MHILHEFLGHTGGFDVSSNPYHVMSYDSVAL